MPRFVKDKIRKSTGFMHSHALWEDKKKSVKKQSISMPIPGLTVEVSDISIWRLVSPWIFLALKLERRDIDVDVFRQFLIGRSSINLVYIFLGCGCIFRCIQWLYNFCGKLINFYWQAKLSAKWFTCKNRD